MKTKVNNNKHAEQEWQVNTNAMCVTKANQNKNWSGKEQIKGQRKNRERPSANVNVERTHTRINLYRSEIKKGRVWMGVWKAHREKE